MDEEECDRRRGEYLTDLTDLERQFSLLREQLVCSSGFGFVESDWINTSLYFNFHSEYTGGLVKILQR